jgi:hypothetical protein
MPDSDKFVQVTDSLIARIEAPRCVKREAHRTHTEALGSSAQMRCLSC